jgi:hypothetical protein
LPSARPPPISSIIYFNGKAIGSSISPEWLILPTNENTFVPAFLSNPIEENYS